MDIVDAAGPTQGGGWRLYVDGACQENRNVTAATPAAWGLVVVEGDSGLGRGRGEPVHEAQGPVVTDPEAPGFIGAEVGSNNTAELCGVAAALRWLLADGGDEPAIIAADSLYAVRVGSGEWRAKANKQLALHVQRLWREVASLRPLSWEHVRAHRGHRWNERADHLAYRAMSGEDPLPMQFWKPGRR